MPQKKTEKTPAQRALEILQRVTGVPYTTLPEVVSSVTQPFRRMAAVGTELAKPLYEQQTGQQLTPEQLEAATKIQQFILGKSGQEQFAEEYASNPALVAGKAGVGQMATFLPAGSSYLSGLSPVLGNILGAGISGAGYGFSRSKEGREKEATIIGGVSGLATGTLFEGIKGLNARIKAHRAETPRKIDITDQIEKDPFFVSKEQDLQALAEDVGVNEVGMSPRDKLRLLEQDFKTSEEQIQGMLKNERFDSGQLADNLAERVSQTDYTPDNKTYRDKVNTQLEKLSEIGDDAVALAEYKSKLRGMLTNAFKKINAGNPLTKDEEIRMATWSAIKDTLDEVSPEIRILNNRQSGLYKLADSIASIVQKDKPYTFAPLGVGAELPVSKEQVSRGTQKVWETLGLTGKLAEKVASPVLSGISAIPQQLMQLLTGVGIGSLTEAQKDKKVTPETLEPQMEKIEITPEIRSSLDPEKQRALDIIDQAEAEAGSGVSGMQITPEMAIMAQIMLPSQEAQKITNAYKIQQETLEKETKQEKLTQAQQSAVQAQEMSQQAYDLLKTKDIKTGMIAGPAEDLKAKLGLGADQDTYDFNVLISNILAMIAKARAGTALSEGEKKLLKKYVPQVGDSKQELETKLRLLQTDTGKSALQELMTPTTIQDLTQQLNI